MVGAAFPAEAPPRLLEPHLFNGPPLAVFWWKFPDCGRAATGLVGGPLEPARIFLLLVGNGGLSGFCNSLLGSLKNQLKLKDLFVNQASVIM